VRQYTEGMLAVDIFDVKERPPGGRTGQGARIYAKVKIGESGKGARQVLTLPFLPG
jgi:hypothetical protein